MLWRCCGLSSQASGLLVVEVQQSSCDSRVCFEPIRFVVGQVQISPAGWHGQLQHEDSDELEEAGASLV